MRFLASRGWDHFHRIADYTDREGHTGHFEYRNDTGHLTSFTNERGERTIFTYTESAPQTINNPEIVITTVQKVNSQAIQD